MEILGWNAKCVGNCCSGGFQDARALRKNKKRKQWRTVRFEDFEDIDICTVPVGNKNVGNNNSKETLKL